MKLRGISVGIALAILVGLLPAALCGQTSPTPAGNQQPAASERPNILWITSEDNSPYLGCYGDPQAYTPRLDRLAAEGVRYRNAFANAPVCSTARTTLVTGMLGCTAGLQHHRSRVAIPEQFELYPQVLRRAGYYCTNNTKTDYNLANQGKVWDENSKQAHYRHRPAGQPFFAVFNIGATHESQVSPKPGKTTFRIAPEDVQLPPYHPATPELRRDWANYYDQMTELDTQVGQLLDELERLGEADNTIVFYFSDHGGALPRGKRNIHDSGTRVPMIVRFPKRWEHLAPAKPGEWVENPVSFVDLPPTLFHLVGVNTPENYQGRAFLGKQHGPDRNHVFLFRGRMDERYDNVRAIRDRHYRYVRNYAPHRPWGQHYSYPFRVMEGMGSWYQAFVNGQCNDVQARYWQPKPAEELYEIAADPYEINNLVGQPEQAKRLAAMRQVLRSDIIAARDTGFIPEGMFDRLAGDKTIYEYARSEAYPIERIVDLANLATDGNPANLPTLIAALRDEHPVIRYWGATGCLILKDKSQKAKEALVAALDDSWLDVAVVAAETLGHLGESEQALATLDRVIKTGNRYEALAALNALDFMREAGHVSLARAQAMVRDVKPEEPGQRIPNYLLGLQEP
jgi:N-sulfoglucosamine sulfohydrolase